jgi:hypothetical protein
VLDAATLDGQQNRRRWSFEAAAPDGNLLDRPEATQTQAGASSIRQTLMHGEATFASRQILQINLLPFKGLAHRASLPGEQRARHFRRRFAAQVTAR